MRIEETRLSTDGVPRLEADLSLDEALLFQPDACVRVLGGAAGEALYSCVLSAALPVAWLPRGRYRLRCHMHDLEIPAGDYCLQLDVFAEAGLERSLVADQTVPFTLDRHPVGGGLAQAAWSLESLPGPPPVEGLAWNCPDGNWWSSHFDHAALVVTDLMLRRHPLLKGRILDVGCGDGIIDLGIFHRVQPELLVGIDPYRGYERLHRALADNGLPPELADDERLRFLPEDANAIPFPDSHFDVVVSWGSLEHIAGGYGQSLREIRRVLKKDGLLFAHPGLYYGALGNHLGEFFDDPFIHLKLPPEELREAVLGTEPKRIDRAGHVATPKEYWQWYTELNPITVAGFERELRELGFEPWRVALRSSDLVEYSPELQSHPMQDLATAELYLSAWNRKP